MQDIDQVYGSLYPEHKGVPRAEVQKLACVTTPVKGIPKQQKSATFFSDPDWTSIFGQLPKVYKTSLQFVANLNPIIGGKDGQELIDVLPEVCNKFLELAD